MNGALLFWLGVVLPAVVFFALCAKAIYHFRRWKALERLPEIAWLIEEGFVRVWVENERWSEKQDCVVYDLEFDDSLSPWKLIKYSSADGYAVLAHKDGGYKPLKIRKNLLEKVGGI